MNTRRTFLVAVGAAIAGCAGLDSDQTSMQAPTPSAGTATESTTPTETPASSERRTTSASRSDPPAGEAVQWAYQTNGPMTGQWPDHGTDRPVVHDGTVYAVGGTNDRGTPPQRHMRPPRSQNVYAVDTDGTHRWRYAASKSVPAVAPTADSMCAIVGWNTPVMGIDQQLIRLVDGELQWMTEPRDKSLSILGTDDGTAIVSTHDHEISRRGESLIAITPDIGSRFERETGDIHQAVVQDGTVYALEGPDRTSAFSTSDGTRRWSHPGSLLGEPVEHYGDTLYVEKKTDSDDSALVAVDASTGESSWQYQRGKPPRTASM